MKTKYIFSALLCSASLSATAQQLTKEVVIDREVEPQMREVTRPDFSPKLYSAPIKTLTLRPFEYNRKGEVRRQLSLLDPAAYADTFAVSPYRGYARIGYLPTYNLGASAGYRFINSADMHLGAWLNYAGQSYNVNPANFLDPTVSDEDKVALSQHTFDLGVDFGHHTAYGDLTADARFTYASVGQPMYEKDFTQDASGFAVDLGWKASTKAWPWHIGISFDTFGFGKKTPGIDEYKLVDARAAYTPTAVREYVYGVNAGLAKAWGKSAVGLDLDFRFQHLTSLNCFDSRYQMVEGGPSFYETVIDNLGDKNFNLLRFSPYYKFVGKSFNLRAGLNVDVLTGFESKTRIAPDVYVAWTPSQQFAVWAKADAPTQLTRVRSLYNYSPYMTSQFAVSPTLINYDVRAGVTVGTFSNIAIQAWVGYSDADFAPVIAATDKFNYFMGQQNGALAYGANISWSYRSLLSVYATAEGAENKDNKVYYPWTDKARWDVKAGLSVNPMDKLSLGVDWHFRSGRHGYMVDYTATVAGTEAFSHIEPYRRGLGIINDLEFNASYRLTDAFTIFANIENLMCRRWQTVPGVETARLHGLVGVGYKF